MNNLKKKVLEVKVGDTFKCIKEGDFFTIGNDYKVQTCDYKIGTESTDVEFLDDEYDLHMVTESFLLTNFKKQ